MINQIKTIEIGQRILIKERHQRKHHEKNKIDGLVSIKKLTNVINSMNEVESGELEEFTEEQVRGSQKVVRKALPHLATSTDTTMTPLEASVIMYYVITGDDGSKPDGAMNLSADNDDIQAFLKLLLQEEDSSKDVG